MKTMISENGYKYNVLEHIKTVHGWEYYVIKAPTNTEEVKFCYIMGFENEPGDVYMPEIEPYILSKASGAELEGLLPPPGFTWV